MGSLEEEEAVDGGMRGGASGCVDHTLIPPSMDLYALVPVGSRSWRPWPDEAGMGMAIRIDGWMDVQSYVFQ
ncbi:hypothetical protein OsI_19032 [Oryza sativa Indica Group]|uniref:Uncharacterized protein n=1 Tax=Oryza sativa subsp. indica TaxID=39946 RepID=B8AZM6_ORYSI|nr:hypothetical protein OsI_19032 [Oryza sativa Indica Group]